MLGEIKEEFQLLLSMIKSKQTIITDCGECTNNENTTYQLMEYHQGFTQRNIHSIEQLSYQEKKK